ncbi:MAG: GNAT family N-acetyltransferase [Clostridia bacterium]|nr:GNAT family N-acetyltransferase [Clostridia bacterium]
MIDCGTITLETPRLILRRFRADDAETIFLNWASDPEVTKYLTWPTHKNVAETASILAEWVAAYEKPDFYNWAIELKSLGKPIGSIGLAKRNEEVKSVMVGYCIGKRWWRQGIVSEALAAVIRFFFEQAGVSRIEAEHDTFNPNSGKVMQKCGMVYEGTLRKARRNNTGIIDSAVYAILAQDYFNKS